MRTHIQRSRRILLVITNLGRAGAEAQLVHLAEGLRAGGDEVTIVCLDRATIDLEPLRREGVEIVILGPAARFARAGGVFRLARLARRHDLVHCTMWDASL